MEQTPAATRPPGPVASAPEILSTWSQGQVFGYDANYGSDDFAGDHQLHTAILLAAFRCVIRSHGLRLAESTRRHGRRRNVFLHQVSADGTGPLFGKLLVHAIAANAVGVAFDGQPEVRVGK